MLVEGRRVLLGNGLGGDPKGLRTFALMWDPKM